MTTAPQTVIQLSERSAEDGRFRVRVQFPDAEYDVDVTDPADKSSEDELAWYFKEHLRYPLFLDKDRERDAVQQITDYGTALFGQVFGGVASHDYRTLRERSFDSCRLEVSGEEASRLLLDAAVGWHNDEGQWSQDHLQWLHRERAVVGADEFAALVRDNVPGELAGELTTAIDQAQNPAEEADSGAAGAPGPGDNL
jgi:hypothetical protein